VLPPVRPMTAAIASAMPIGKDWTYEVNWDGYRALLLNAGDLVRLVSRNLKDLTRENLPLWCMAGPVQRAR
jgi:ATP-dependent DNA ligase